MSGRERRCDAFILPLVVALVLAVTAGAANAQAPPLDFAHIQASMKPDDVLVVTHSSGRLVKWKVADVPVELLVRRAAITPTDIRQIAVERVDSPWNGALIGLAIAGVPWLIVCAANDWCYYNEYGAENLLRTTAITTAAIGAGMGALIDRSIRTRIALYPVNGRSVTLGVAPARSGAGASLRMSILF